jgi:hypothetical protein
MARTAVLRANPYCEHFQLCADFELFVRLLGNGHKLANLPAVLVRYRKHAGGLSQAEVSWKLRDAAKRAIFRAQLTALGIAFTERDLAQHAWLCRRPHVHGQRWKPDDAYLEWAEQWLLRLCKANRRVARYPPGELDRAIRQRWFKLCRRAYGRLAWRAWQRYWQSPLRHGC